MQTLLTSGQLATRCAVTVAEGAYRTAASATCAIAAASAPRGRTVQDTIVGVGGSEAPNGSLF